MGRHTARVEWSNAPGAPRPAGRFHATRLPPATMLPALAEFQAVVVRERGLPPTAAAFRAWAVADGGADGWGLEVGGREPPGFLPCLTYRVTGLAAGPGGGVLVSVDARGHGAEPWRTVLRVTSPVTLFGHAARLLRRQAVQLRRTLALGRLPADGRLDPRALARRAARYELLAAAEAPPPSAHAMRWTPPPAALAGEPLPSHP